MTTLTDIELASAAYRARLVDVPECGFLLDDQPADSSLYPAIARMVDDGLLARASSHRFEQCLLLPTPAGLDLIGVSAR